MLDGQGGHPSRPHNQDRTAGQPAQGSVGQVGTHLEHGHGGRPDRRLGPNPPTSPDGRAEQRGKRLPGSALGFGGAIGLPDLGQDLGLSQHHGVDSRGDGEQMLCGVVLVVGVQRIGELLGRQLARLGQEPLQVEESRVVGIDRRVDLDPVARREDGSLRHRVQVEQTAKGLREVLPAEGEALEQLDRSPAIGDPQGEDRHQERRFRLTAARP